jgi:hypothetical protein
MVSCRRSANSANTVEVVINVLTALITTAGYFLKPFLKDPRNFHSLELLCLVFYVFYITFSIYYMAAVA